MSIFEKMKKMTDAGKQMIGKASEKAEGVIRGAGDKLAYSEEDIAARRQKDGIVYVFDGGNGTLMEVYADRVTLYHNKSLLGSFAGFLGETVGEKTLYATDLSSVEFKEAQKWCIGYIRFAVMNGGNARKSTGDAASDPNSVAIAFVEKNAEAAEIKHYLDNMIASARQRGTNPVVMQKESAADELRKYKELLDQGILTQEEFEAKKKQLLGI